MENFSWLAIAPDGILLLGALGVLGAEVIWKPGHRVWAAITGGSVVLAILMALVQWNRVADQGASLHYSGPGVGLDATTPMYVLDAFSAFGGVILYSVTGLALVAAWRLVADLDTRGAEFVALTLLSAIGLHLMVASANLVMLFLSLEVASISLYVIAGFTRERIDADESAMKYFLLGSFASAVFVYGIALVFAGTGTTSIYGATGLVAHLDSSIVVQPGVLLAGIAMLIVGLGFKVSAAPFHMWAPDVYQGAPSGAVGFMSAGVKVAGFAVLARVLAVGFERRIDDWAPALAVIAVVSIVVGTAFAIAQTDLKRMLAYSGVAHAGFIATGLVAGVDGIPAIWFYVATYAIQLIGAFTVVSVVGSHTGGASAIADYSGLAQRRPALAALLATMMLAMAGIPLTSGFIGKAAVFTAAIDAGYLWLAIAALVAAVAGLYFYLNVIVVMYMRAPALAEGPGAAVATPEAGPTDRAVLAVAGALTIVLGIIPWPLLNAARDALPL